MPAPATVDEMLDLLRRSKLLEASKLEAYLVTHPGPYATPKDLLLRMQGDGVVTPFQAEQLLKGKHRGYFLGKYKILDRIGMGGMGQVFLAEHVSMRRRAAIKVLPPDRSNDQYKRERFLREARAAGQLDHPNLVRAFDVDEQDDVLFLTMEYVDGITLHDLVIRHGVVDPHRVAFFLWQTACGLSYMASCNLIHRDIKPANLLLDRQGVVKILDLGLVRSEVEQDNLTRGEGVKTLGTADYLAPEQAIDCSTVDIRADIYSLGATAYFMLTGRPLFTMEQLSQKLIAHQMKPITPIRQLRPEVPEDLAAIVEKMLAKKREERQQHPDEIVRALDAWALTPPDPPTEEEIPMVVGGIAVAATSVNLSSHQMRPGQSGSSSNVAVGGVSSGSMLRYHSDRMKVHDAANGRAASSPPPSSGHTKTGATTQIPAKALSSRGIPSPLPPVPSTPVTTPPPVDPVILEVPTKIGLDELFQKRPAADPVTKPQPYSPAAPSAVKRYAILAVALLVALAIGAGGMALLSGAYSTPSGENAPAIDEDSENPQASAN